ncbi:phosphoribosylformylglycinamidine synthase [Deltaproteobacteria bacterium Smac51]|nr:phosphoribosylformylglycinamidine synthase [Deltaproteobacteria bacterium Smac51]
MFKATVEVMLKKSVLDPQGAAVERALKSYGNNDIQSVRIGKMIEIMVDGKDEAEVRAKAKDWADKLLVNPIMETFTINVEPVK